RTRSCLDTIAGARSWRLRLLGFLVRMWRRCDWARLNPLAVWRKRFAAARLVFNLGMSGLVADCGPLRYASCESAPSGGTAPLRWNVSQETLPRKPCRSLVVTREGHLSRSVPTSS